MKRLNKIALLAVLLASAFCFESKADSLKDLLGKISGSDVADVISGVVGSTNLTVADLEGTWNYSGPAVIFLSDDILEKAGGAAAATTIEKKLTPYYTKLGLAGSTMTCDATGNFTLTIKGKSVKGSLTANADGSFALKLGSSAIASKLGSNKNITVYIKKSGNTLSIAGDVKKMLEIVKKLSSASTTISKVTTLLDKYDGICIGFKMSK